MDAVIKGKAKAETDLHHLPRPSRDEAEAAVRTLIAWAGDHRAQLPRNVRAGSTPLGLLRSATVGVAPYFTRYSGEPIIAPTTFGRLPRLLKIVV